MDLVIVGIVVGVIAFIILFVVVTVWGAHYYYNGPAGQRDKAMRDYFYANMNANMNNPRNPNGWTNMNSPNNPYGWTNPNSPNNPNSWMNRQRHMHR